MTSDSELFYPTHAERVEALLIGASALDVRWPRLQTSVIVVPIGPDYVPAHAALGWPGIVRVSVRHTGQLIAQSLPGKPFELDLSASH